MNRKLIQNRPGSSPESTSKASSKQTRFEDPFSIECWLIFAPLETDFSLKLEAFILAKFAWHWKNTNSLITMYKPDCFEGKLDITDDKNTFDREENWTWKGFCLISPWRADAKCHVEPILGLKMDWKSVPKCLKIGPDASRRIPKEARYGTTEVWRSMHELPWKLDQHFVQILQKNDLKCFQNAWN